MAFYPAVRADVFGMDISVTTVYFSFLLHTMNTPPPIHQWTHTGKQVLLVKCINRDGTSYGGFVWPKSGPVKPDKWSREPDCESGGLFGWPWGMGIGEGREPDACAEWIVFAALPENVIDVSGKAKAVPGEYGTLPEIVYRGTQAGAMYHTISGRLAWIQKNSNGVASTSGDSSSASTSDDSSSASTSGDRSSASTSGDSSSASTSGYRSSASTSGYSSSASTSGDRSIAAATGEYSTLECKNGVCVCTADRCYWKPHPGSILVCQYKAGDAFSFSILSGDGQKEGEVVKVEFGGVVSEFSE